MSLTKHEKFDVFFRSCNLVFALATLFIGFCTYNNNKTKDRRSRILEYCSTVNTLPLSLKLASDQLAKNRTKESLENYREELQNFFANIEAKGSTQTDLYSSFKKFFPSYALKQSEVDSYINSIDPDGKNFTAQILETLRKIQKRAIESCITQKENSI